MRRFNLTAAVLVLALAGCGQNDPDPAAGGAPTRTVYVDSSAAPDGFADPRIALGKMDSVFIGRVLSVVAPPDDAVNTSGGLPKTYFSVQVDTPIKGPSAGARLTVGQPGGIEDGVATFDRDVPLAEVGHTYLFAVESNPDRPRADLQYVSTGAFGLRTADSPGTRDELKRAFTAAAELHLTPDQVDALIDERVREVQRMPEPE